MIAAERLRLATADRQVVADEWMEATATRAFIMEDPGVAWLELHGHLHDFFTDRSPYEFLDFIAEKGAQFERKWQQEMAPEATLVCQAPYEVQRADRLAQTFQLMQTGAPIIAQPALWWGPEQIYGTPDLIARVDWLRQRLPTLTPWLDQVPAGLYVVLDLKFTSRLEDRPREHAANSAQVLLYSYMLGQLQGHVPEVGFLVTRDRHSDPLPVAVTARVDQPLDAGLSQLRSAYLDIKLNGARYAPWRDPQVAINLNNKDDRWQEAKKAIAQRIDGGDVCRLPWIGLRQKQELADAGYPTLEAMLAVDPATIPLENCTNIGRMAARRIRAVLAANREDKPVLRTPEVVPKPLKHEFFVDYEYLTDLNVDFNSQWPTLEGREMIFMVGVGWEEDGEWRFRALIADRETPEAEHQLLQAFISLIEELSEGDALDPASTALYHWSSAEAWQSRKAANRHDLPDTHALRRLPWFDLEAQVAKKGSLALPGAWNFKLKSMARALGGLDPLFDPQWPGDLDQGKRAMVMGWRAYQFAEPALSHEMKLLTDYLDADCRAMWHLLRWLRATATSALGGAN